MTRIARAAAMAALLGGISAAGIAAAQDAPDAPPPATPPSAAPMGHPMGGPMGGPMAMMGFGPGRIDFVAIDTDGNGSLSRAELVARATERLANADADGDGTLTRAEIVDAMPGPRLLDLFGANPAEAFADRMLALMGATEAGQVTVADLAGQRVNFLLAFADTDRDAAVSQAEADAMGSRHRGGMGRHHGGPDRSDRGGPDRDGPDRDWPGQDRR